MDISKCDIICENQPAQGKQLTDFMKNFQMLDEDEQLEAFTISSSDTLTILDQSVPCVGCRRRYLADSIQIFLLKKINKSSDVLNSHFCSILALNAFFMSLQCQICQRWIH